jgi:hypothetical protein
MFSKERALALGASLVGMIPRVGLLSSGAVSLLMAQLALRFF